MTLARRLLKYRVASVHIRRQRLQRHLWEYALSLEEENKALKANLGATASPPFCAVSP